jgi:hypothetical protein
MYAAQQNREQRENIAHKIAHDLIDELTNLSHDELRHLVALPAVPI